MPADALPPFLATVWQPRDLHRTVVDLARDTATLAIFDFSRQKLSDWSDRLREVAATQIKISSADFLSAGLSEVVQAAGVDTLWVEYHPAEFPYEEGAFLSRIRELTGVCRVVPISGDVDFLLKVVQAASPPPMVALKGIEASGLVGSETLGVLYALLEQTLKDKPQAPGLVIWGGVGTPEAAAAFLASGARGVVLESLHWLTDLVSASPEFKEKLARLDLEHTAIVGRALGVACRVYDKGNSLAVRELKSLADRLLGEEDEEEARRTFAAYVKEHAVPAPESRLGRDELILLGPEAAFAPAFVRRFGSDTRRALFSFLEEVDRLLKEADKLKDCFRDSPAARELGTVYPFFQGAMTWISDVPEFALAVAEAGGLPTLALGLRDRQALDRDLGRVPEILKGRPFAINVLALPENPFLKEQLAWVEELRPPLTVIAAGDPAYAQRLNQQGLSVCYLAPNEGLLRLALKAGVRWVVLEGHEAGGHVGAHSTLTLAQMALELRRQEPELFRHAHVVLAGGIYNRATAFRAAMLGADGLQMGTVYLATREIVATGALSPLYQKMILEAGPGATTVSGETVGLGVRSLKTAKLKAILALEREFAAGREEEASFRRRLEALGARSLLIAARGVREPGGPRLDEDTCLREGQFMSGAVAGAISRVVSVAQLHEELASGPLNLACPRLAPLTGPVVLRHPTPKGSRERVAITGMALVNALGNSPREVWEASLARQSGIIEVPSTRWDHSLYYDPDPRAPEKTYCKVAAFQNLTITRKELGIPPQDFRTMSNSTKLTLWLAHQAIHESGILASGIPPERIAVLVSQNSGEVASTLRDLVIGIATPHLVRSLGKVITLPPHQMQAATEFLKSDLIRVDDTTLLGRLNCTAGGFICNKYGFRGPSYSVSAACATSLVALFAALMMLKNGVIDAAVVGGGEETLTPAHFLEFSALGALAGISGRLRRPEEMSRPFDAHRDGMVLGEGGAVIVIERESVARRRGVRIHAYITGIGASNSDQGMVESLAETQEIAIRAAFHDAAVSPETVDLVECHATATVQGDVEEVRALKAFFPQGRTTYLTSFKSQIGHTLGASGLNSLIRGVMAMQAGVIPPTLNYDTPDPAIDLESWGFRAPGTPEAWPVPPDRPRRLMVNAFGFGGANYVVHLEENLEDRAVVLVSPALEPRSVPPSAPVPEEEEAPPRVNGVSFFRAAIGGRPHHLAVLANNDREAQEKVAALSPFDPTISLTDRERRALERQGIFLAPAGASPPPLALVFAGQGTFYHGMGKELYDHFPPIRRWMDRLAEVADFDLLHLLFHSRDENLQRTLWQQPALFTLNYAIVRHLLDLGLRPTAMAGHSLGELVALCVAGVFSYEDGFRIVHKRAQCMDKAGDIKGDPGTMMAVNVPLDLLEAKVAARDNLYITNYNSPRQIVVGGGTQEVRALKEELDREGYWTYPLKVSMAFHSPIMKVIREEMQAFVDTITFHPPRIPVISNTTQRPYPDDPEEIKGIIMAHLESPVHWLQNVKTLWEDFGVRLFVEVGPKDTLCNLVMETIPEAVTIPTCDPEGEPQAFRTAAARLYTLGHLPKVRPNLTLDLSASAPGKSGPASGLASTPEMVAAIVQREINHFILESFGKYLKPAILAALRREVDPAFSEAALDRVLGTEASVSSVLPAILPQVPADSPALLSQAVSPPEPRPQPPEGAAPAPALSSGDYLERIIRIIMDATGYEREEIEPDMDLRQDLAIRSSRLPVIMDAAEREFGIVIKIEDFLGVRTVQDLADRLAQVVAQQGGAPAAPAPAAPQSLAPPVKALAEPESQAETSAPPLPLRRLVFRPAPLFGSSGGILSLKPGQTVAILRLGPGHDLAGQLEDFGRRRWQARMVRLDGEGLDNTPGGLDLRTPEGVQVAVQRLTELSPLAGLFLILADPVPGNLNFRDLPQVLTGLFQVVQTLMQSPAREFCVLLTRNLDHASPLEVLAQGLVGLFLAAAQEYPDFLFRSVRLGSDLDLQAALSQALNRDNGLVEIFLEGSQVLGLQAVEEPLSWRRELEPLLKPGDVVVISGGARGVTPYLAQALAPFSPRLVLLGRTLPDPEVDFEALLRDGGDEPALQRFLRKTRPELTGSRLEKELGRLKTHLEVVRTLKEFAHLGLKARYYPCNVADFEEVRNALSRVVEEWGRIDGVVHGAGITRDSFLALMTSEDFAQVVGVKLTGALNLLEAARPHGLRFMVALSSAACIQGNPGQANYAAANRAMSALLAAQSSLAGNLFAKALMLPPIEGVGMAAAPEIKELLKLKGLEPAYVHAREIAQFFVRELNLGRPEDVWVMPVRFLPQVKTTLLKLPEGAAETDSLTLAGVAAGQRDFPLVDRVRHLDLMRGELEAERVFHSDRDLWIDDHRPFKFLKHPPVSGIMAVETFIEAARLLYPHLKVVGLRQVAYRDLLDCPLGQARLARIFCRALQADAGQVLCQVTISSPMLSPSGRELDRWSTNFAGQVVLGVEPPVFSPLPGLPVSPEEMETRPMPPEEVADYYQNHTTMGRRYQVLHSLEGTAAGCIRGVVLYREIPDFSGFELNNYHYSPYLFEAFLHLVNFYLVMRDEKEERRMIPAGFGELRFRRPCRQGERVVLEARLINENPEGNTWNCRALDDSGDPLMQVQGLEVRWFTQ
uniref:SDR family NAD(P)-dependent oxidoreductase n=1 Tax=Desulfobacca acetoxidans TaxID=60893 RepID=A0A7C5EMD4_9BACT